MNVIFEAFDGRQFSNEKSCIDYERNELLNVKKSLESIETLLAYCNSHSGCSHCMLDRWYCCVGAKDCNLECARIEYSKLMNSEDNKD